MLVLSRNAQLVRLLGLQTFDRLVSEARLRARLPFTARQFSLLYQVALKKTRTFEVSFHPERKHKIPRTRHVAATVQQRRLPRKNDCFVQDIFDDREARRLGSVGDDDVDGAGVEAELVLDDDAVGAEIVACSILDRENRKAKFKFA